MSRQTGPVDKINREEQRLAVDDDGGIKPVGSPLGKGLEAVVAVG